MASVSSLSCQDVPSMEMNILYKIERRSLGSSSSGRTDVLMVSGSMVMPVVCFMGILSILRDICSYVVFIHL